MFLPKIYPITDVELSRLSHFKQTKKLLNGGAGFIQIREKKASSADFYTAAKVCLEEAKVSGAKIIINDRVDIALALKADGVHLGQSDLPPAEARKLLGEQAIIGFSTHNVNQAIEARSLPINYIAIGPVFTTRTKSNPDQVVGLDGVRSVREAIGSFPLVAIGGINGGNFLDVLDTGADSVAIVSGLLSNPDGIDATFKNLISQAQR